MDELVEHWTVPGDLLAGAALLRAGRAGRAFAAAMVPLMLLSEVWNWWMFRDRPGRTPTYL